MSDQLTTYVCEVCDKAERLTEEDAFNAGWDYPPFMGAWGVVSPRTCGECSIIHTVWFALMVDRLQPGDLTVKHIGTIARILAEKEEHGD